MMTRIASALHQDEAKGGNDSPIKYVRLQAAQCVPFDICCGPITESLSAQRFPLFLE